MNTEKIVTKSEIFNEALLVCEKACSLRKQMAEEIKSKSFASDELVFSCENANHYNSVVSEMEDSLDSIAEKLKSVKWGFSYFWSVKMSKVKGYNKEIHFYPTKVIKFIDWARYSINKANNIE